MALPAVTPLLLKLLSSFIECPLDGHVPEWLWSGLQNRLPRFNSGRGLHEISGFAKPGFGRNNDHDCRRWPLNKCVELRELPIMMVGSV